MAVTMLETIGYGNFSFNLLIIGYLVMLVFMYIGGFIYVINNNSNILLGTISWSLVIGGSLLLVTVIGNLAFRNIAIR